MGSGGRRHEGGVEGYITAAEVAELLGISRRSVYDYARVYSDFPEPIHVGRTPLWSREQVAAWRERHPRRPW